LQDPPKITQILIFGFKIPKPSGNPGFQSKAEKALIWLSKNSNSFETKQFQMKKSSVFATQNRQIFLKFGGDTFKSEKGQKQFLCEL
jgi:hypothetical protein